MDGTPSPLKPNLEIGSEVINTELSGYLFKRRGGYGKLTFNPWQLRYFTIKDGYLSYYENQESPESESRGSFDLREEFDMQGGPCSIEGSPNSFTIQLSIPNEEKWKLCAENKDEYLKWKTAINGFWGLKGSTARTPKKVDESGYSSPNPSIVQRLSTIGSSGISAIASSGSLSAQPTPRSVDSSSNNSDSGRDTSPKVSMNNLASVSTIDPTPKVPTPAAITGGTSDTIGAPSTKQPRKILKAKVSSGMINSDQLELLMVIIIFNISLIMFNQSSSSLMSGLYVIIANFVVIQTLLLRAERSKTSRAGVEMGEISSTSSGVSAAAVPINSNSSITTMSSSSPISPPEGADSNVSDVNTMGGRPIAGGTYPYFEGVSPNVPPHTWSKCDHKRFKVRDIDYEKLKQKCPSDEPLYSVFAVDVFCTDNRIDNVTQHMELPDCSDLQINNPHVPPVFCVQVQMPSDPPASSFSPYVTEDGPGWAIVVYFKMTQKTCNQLNGIEEPSNAVKLFSSWCENYQDKDWKARFKVIASCLNMEELGVPSMVTSWNAKPVLIRRTSTLYKTPQYMETTIHVFKFANMAKSSIHMLTSRCSQMFMEIGFLIEGRGNPQLPECLIGCASVNKPSEEKVGYLFND